MERTSMIILLAPSNTLSCIAQKLEISLVWFVEAAKNSGGSQEASVLRTKAIPVLFLFPPNHFILIHMHPALNITFPNLFQILALSLASHAFLGKLINLTKFSVSSSIK